LHPSREALQLGLQLFVCFKHTLLHVVSDRTHCSLCFEDLRSQPGDGSFTGFPLVSRLLLDFGLQCRKLALECVRDIGHFLLCTLHAFSHATQSASILLNLHQLTQEVRHLRLLLPLLRGNGHQLFLDVCQLTRELPTQHLSARSFLADSFRQSCLQRRLHLYQSSGSRVVHHLWVFLEHALLDHCRELPKLC